jgi:hypothetical protein
MLRLSKPTLTFKVEYSKKFLRNHNKGLDLLLKLLENPMVAHEDITSFQVSSFRNPYREIAWLFTRIIGHDSTSIVSQMALYILYFTIKEQTIFYWGKLISHEICSQLSSLKKEKRFFM